MKKKMYGVTLIELMIVVAIVGILAAVIYPSYRDSTLKGQRSVAKEKLIEIMQIQERFYTANQTYVTTLSTLGYPADTVDSERGYYSIAAVPCPGATIQTCVQLTAMAQHSAVVDDDCGALVYDSRGRKTVTGALPVERCW